VHLFGFIIRTYFTSVHLLVHYIQVNNIFISWFLINLVLKCSRTEYNELRKGYINKMKYNRKQLMWNCNALQQILLFYLQNTRRLYKCKASDNFKHQIEENSKGKAVPLQARSGPEGSRKLRFPDYLTTAQGAGKVVSPTHRPSLPPGNTHFC